MLLWLFYWMNGSLDQAETILKNLIRSRVEPFQKSVESL